MLLDNPPARRIERSSRVVATRRATDGARKTTLGRAMLGNALRSSWALLSYHPAGEALSCPSCGSQRLEVLDFGARTIRPRLDPDRVYLVSGCPSCGLIFTNPPPTPEYLAAYYGAQGGWNQRGNEVRSEPALAGRRRPSGKTQLGQIVARAAQAGMTNPAVLDFGCGEGELLDKLHSFGWRTFGIDPATRSIVTRHAMLDAIPTQPLFDVIVAKHVLEHLPDPMSVLRQFRSALRPGGFLFCVQPCLDGAFVHGRKRYCINDKWHFTAFTHDSIRQLLSTAGFKVEFSTNLAWPHRFQCMAVPADEIDLSSADDPLRSARDDLRRTRIRWLQFLPIRMQASLLNAALLMRSRIARFRRAGNELSGNR